MTLGKAYDGEVHLRGILLHSFLQWVVGDKSHWKVPCVPGQSGTVEKTVLMQFSNEMNISHEPEREATSSCSIPPECFTDKAQHHTYCKGEMLKAQLQYGRAELKGGLEWKKTN